jgi:hypothetical protein
VTRFAPQKALKIIAPGELSFDEWVVFHRVNGYLAHKGPPFLTTTTGPNEADNQGQILALTVFYAPYSLDIKTNGAYPFSGEGVIFDGRRSSFRIAPSPPTQTTRGVKETIKSFRCKVRRSHLDLI